MWPDENGNWGTWDSGGYVPDTTGAAGNTGDIVTSTGAATSGQDKYSGWFQSLVGNVVNYAIAKDAKSSGVQPVTNATGQVVYRTVPAPAGNGLLLALGAAAIFLLARKG